MSKDTDDDLKDDGGPAFSCVDSMGDGPLGMSLRDYFAAKAMGGWLATYTNNEHPAESETYVGWLATYSYVTADAMLRERTK